MNKLRKVLYRLSDPTGFTPNLSDQNRTEQEMDEEERPGYFHIWTQVAMVDAETNIPIAVTQAIIEDEVSHNLKTIPIEWFYFVEDPLNQE